MWSAVVSHVRSELIDADLNQRLLENGTAALRFNHVESLIPNGYLVCDIFRLLEYTSNDGNLLQDHDELKRRALVLRKGVDGCFDNNLVIPQPRTIASAFCSCFCAVGTERQTVGRPFLHSFPIPPAADFCLALRRHRASAEGCRNRIAVAFRLPAGTKIDNSLWIVDNHSIGIANHVCIAARGPDGIPAAEEVDDVRKFSIPLLAALPWEMTSSMYVCDGTAHWQSAYIPETEGWQDVVLTFHNILCYGNFEEFMDVWRIHALIHEYASKNVMVPLQLAHATIKAFINSDACDGNEANANANRALEFLRRTVESPPEPC